MVKKYIGRFEEQRNHKYADVESEEVSFTSSKWGFSDLKWWEADNTWPDLDVNCINEEVHD